MSTERNPLNVYLENKNVVNLEELELPVIVETTVRQHPQVIHLQTSKQKTENEVLEML